MTINIEWDNAQQTTILYTFSGTWTWDELYVSIGAGEKMAKDAPVAVNAILDLRNSPTLPGGSLRSLNMRGHFQNIINRAHDERGQIVIVGASAIIRSMYTVFRNTFGKKVEGVKFVDTLEEARAIIAENARNTAPDSANIKPLQPPTLA